jgi:hypothetical protein
MIRSILATSALALAAAVALPAAAKDKAPPVTLNKCERSHGTIALVDGDTQGWTKYGLGSPRELIAALAVESGCFTPLVVGSGQSANYLMNVIAGDKEEVDKGIETAKGVAVEGLVRSGAAGRMLGGMGGFGGQALGMLGGLGGKKKTVAAGIRLISPATGQTLVSGTGDVTKTSITLGGIGGGLQQGAAAAGYGGSKDGQMLVEAFIKAFNAVSAQAAGLPQVAAAAPAAAAPASAATAVDTKMYASADKNSSVLRSLRAGTALKPTGQRQGLFVEAEDGFGTKGWVSVEDLK